MITGHLFRASSKVGNSYVRGIKPGMCVWLGTCNRPASEHERVLAPQRERRAKR